MIYNLSNLLRCTINTSYQDILIVQYTEIYNLLKYINNFCIISRHIYILLLVYTPCLYCIYIIFNYVYIIPLLYLYYISIIFILCLYYISLHSYKSYHIYHIYIVSNKQAKVHSLITTVNTAFQFIKVIAKPASLFKIKLTHMMSLVICDF